MNVEIAKKVAGGLSIYCATCRAHWAGAERGVLCAEPRPCGSPLVGLSFPFHRPPGGISREGLRAFCFMCGGRAAGAVRAAGSAESFGVCAEHRGQLKDLRPERHGGGEFLVHHDGAFVPVGLVTLRRRTLLEEIAHNEELLGGE